MTTKFELCKILNVSGVWLCIIGYSLIKRRKLWLCASQNLLWCTWMGIDSSIWENHTIVYQLLTSFMSVAQPLLDLHKTFISHVVSLQVDEPEIDSVYRVWKIIMKPACIVSSWCISWSTICGKMEGCCVVSARTEKYSLLLSVWTSRRSDVYFFFFNCSSWNWYKLRSLDWYHTYG